MNLPGTQSYVLSGWFKGDAVPDTENKADDPANDKYKQCGLRAELTYDDEENTKEYHYVSFNTDLEDWQFASLAVVPKEPTKTVKSVRIYCAYERNANTGYFDSISLVREAAQTMKYDDDGNLVSVSTTGLNADVDTYDGGNLIQTVTGGNGTYSYTYYTGSLDHRLKSVTDGHVKQSMTYDSFGNVITTELAKDETNSTNPKITTSAEYSADGNRLVSSTDASGSSTLYTYGAGNTAKRNEMTGTPSKVQNAKGVLSLSEYDDFWRVTKSSVENPTRELDEIARLEYNYEKGNLKNVTRVDSVVENQYKDGTEEEKAKAFQTYHFTYDTFGNMTEMRVGEKWLARYSYAAKNGQLLTQTYANSDTVTFTYDSLGRTKTTTYSDGRVLTYTYAGDGGLHSIHDSETGETTTYVRDSLGRLISARGNGEKATQYSYDENNRLTRWVYTIPTLSRTAMHYAYNTDTTDTVPDGVLTGVTMFDGGSITYSYDFLQRLRYKTVAEKMQEEYAYSPGATDGTTTNRVSTKYVRWNNALIHQFQHGYDALGNITNIYDAVTLKRVNYTYDDQGQLLTATHYNNSTKTHTETYTYDNVGNILTFNNGTTSHTYTYGDTQWKDLLTKVDGNTITYDASGNPTEYYNNWTMTWVEGRRLESVTVGSNTYTYQYNADGQRTKKTNPDGSYIEYYVVNGVTVGESHFTAAGNKTLGIRYTLDENNSVIGFTTGGVNYYFSKNLQGDVLEVYNASTNEVVAQYTYDSWGNILTAIGTLAETNPFRYRSYYYDEETNFYYLQSRYYDAAIGRFINADDISYLGADGKFTSYNLYTYCGNNPVMGYDPEGNWDWGTFFNGASLIATGVTAIAAAATILTCGAAAPLMIAVAAVTVTAGALTTVNGVAEVVEAGTGYNVVRDAVFGGDTQAYETYRDATATVAEIGTSICGAYYSSKGGNVCFIAGTLVQTENGAVPIETIVSGDLVWAWDELSGDVALKEVVETYVNQTNELIHVHVNGEEIVTTPTHPFYSPVKGWTSACHLRAGDILVLVNGEYVIVEKVQHEILESPVSVYNFQVADYHTYYVASGVLVHNRCNGNWADGGRGSAYNNSKYHFDIHGTEVGASTLEQYTTKATNFANNVLAKGKKGYYIPGATPNTYRYKFNGKYVDLAYNGFEHLLVSFGSQFH